MGTCANPASKWEFGYSQVSRQESALRAEGNLCMEKLQKQRDERAPCNSNSSGQPVQGATPRPEFQNMRYTNHSYMTKSFQFRRKKLGIITGYSTFTMEALKTNVLRWGMFMSTSMKAAIHLGPNYLANSEVDIGTFWRNYRLKVHLPHGRDQCCLMIKRSSGQKQSYVSTQIQFYVWDRWMKAKKQ